MGLWEFLRQWPGARVAVGVAASVLLHAGLVALVLFGAALPLTARKWLPPPGDALFVELPRPEETARPGTPNAPPPAPAPAAKAAPRPEPPAAVVRREPAPPRREEPRVAKAAPRPAEPAPRASQPPPRASEPAPRAAEPVPTEPDAPAVATPPAAPEPRAAESGPAGPPASSAERQVASLPPAGPQAPPPPDIRSALRRGGGGRGEGRGGILGAPVPLDTPDPRFHEFLDQVRRQIQDKLTYPCVKDGATYHCEPKNTEVIVHFGILKSGRLQYVELWLASQWSIYDAASMTAIRLAQPFPPVPPAIMATLEPGTTGMPIAARFRFLVTTSTIVR